APRWMPPAEAPRAASLPRGATWPKAAPPAPPAREPVPQSPAWTAPLPPLSAGPVGPRLRLDLPPPEPETLTPVIVPGSGRSLAPADPGPWADVPPP
ncbi:MAG: hypothetical protein JWL91_2282, partial [Sphingomonas bacterium]|nr:hypothetical protein [Sphingomonas bacterium]